MSTLVIDRAHLEYRPDMDSFNLLLLQKHVGSNLMVSDFMTYSFPDGGVGTVPPNISRQSAQTLFQALWDAGFRPEGKRAEPSTDHIKAMENHIADLRSIVFKAIMPRVIGPDEPHQVSAVRFNSEEIGSF